MSKRNEKLSAYLDGEIHRDELMSFSLSGEKSDAKTAMRYQLVGDVLRGETSELSTIDISSAVREALADENIVDQISTQMSSSAADSKPILTSNQKDASTNTRGSLFGWLSRPVAGMAMAATVAAVMVLSVTQQNPESTTPVASNDAVNIAPAVTVAAQSPAQLQAQPLPVAVIQNLSSQLAAASVPQAQSVPAAYNPKLNPYLNQHFATQGSFSQGALQSRMPYARAVSLESEK